MTPRRHRAAPNHRSLEAHPTPSDFDPSHLKHPGLWDRREPDGSISYSLNYSSAEMCALGIRHTLRRGDYGYAEFDAHLKARDAERAARRKIRGDELPRRQPDGSISYREVGLDGCEITSWEEHVYPDDDRYDELDTVLRYRE